LAVDLAPEGSEEKVQAQLALEKARLAVSTDQKIRAAEHETEIIRVLRVAEALSIANLTKANDKLDEETARARIVRTLQSSQQIIGALGSIFQKNKAFAIATAIVNTALGITAVWKDDSLPTWYAKLAATLVVAASGAAQISAIRGAQPGGGGGSFGGSSGGVASQPTSPAQNPNSASISQQSESQINALSGRVGSGSGTTVVNNIQYAFGDQQAMTKLARQLSRVNSNDQSVMR
jgi:hypothetical protein